MFESRDKTPGVRRYEETSRRKTQGHQKSIILPVSDMRPCYMLRPCTGVYLALTLAITSWLMLSLDPLLPGAHATLWPVSIGVRIRQLRQLSLEFRLKSCGDTSNLKMSLAR